MCGNNRQIYNWIATQGLGTGPTVSWLPHIQLPKMPSFDFLSVSLHKHTQFSSTVTGIMVLYSQLKGAQHYYRNTEAVLIKILSEMRLALCFFWRVCHICTCACVCVHARAHVGLAAALQKVGLRACYSSPSVWPPLAHKHKLAEGRLLWQKASAQTKPLNILSKSIKASRDWLGLIVCVRYYQGLQGQILVKN